MEKELLGKLDNLKDGTQDVADLTHEKTKEFHEQYVSKVTPDCGKYGDAAKFVAEMAPGVSEYNAVKDGDWEAFCIAAGIDVTAAVIGGITGGAGYAAVKGAKQGGKVIGKEAAEKLVKQGAKEMADCGATKTAKEFAEKGLKETFEGALDTGIGKSLQDVFQKGTKEVAEQSTKELAEKGTKEVAQKSAKEIVETGIKTIDGKKFDDYLESLQKITKRDIRPVQMDKLKESVRNDVFRKLDPDAQKMKVRDFARRRPEMIKEWEKHNGEKWPTYAEDVIEDGIVKKLKGQSYDAHHIIEKQFDGANEWWNIIPATPEQHQGTIHSGVDLAKSIFKE